MAYTVADVVKFDDIYNLQFGFVIPIPSPLVVIVHVVVESLVNDIEPPPLLPPFKIILAPVFPPVVAYP
jgi:hypothetical protein